MLNFGQSSERWVLSSSGNVIIPVVDDTVKNTLSASVEKFRDEKGRIKRADEISNMPETLTKLAANICGKVGGPPAAIPQLTKALTPTIDVLSQLPVLLGVFTIWWLKKYGRQVE